MKSNVCKIEKGTKDLDAILKESEKVAVMIFKMCFCVSTTSSPSTA